MGSLLDPHHHEKARQGPVAAHNMEKITAMPSMPPAQDSVLLPPRFGDTTLSIFLKLPSPDVFKEHTHTHAKLFLALAFSGRCLTELRIQAVFRLYPFF